MPRKASSKRSSRRSSKSRKSTSAHAAHSPGSSHVVKSSRRSRKSPGRARVAGKRRSKSPGTKRGRTGYIQFSVENRSRILSKNPGLTFGQVGKELGQAWRKLSTAEKAEYNRRAKSAK